MITMTCNFCSHTLKAPVEKAAQLNQWMDEHQAEKHPEETK